MYTLLIYILPQFSLIYNSTLKNVILPGIYPKHIMLVPLTHYRTPVADIGFHHILDDRIMERILYVELFMLIHILTHTKFYLYTSLVH